VTRFARQLAVCRRQAPLRTCREDHSRRWSGPWQSCTEARPYTLTPIGRPEDLRWHRTAPSREVQEVDAAGRLLPAGRVGQVRIRLLEGVFSLQNAAAEEEIHVAIESARPIDQTRLAALLGSELQGMPDALVHFIAALRRNDMGKIQRDVRKKSAASSTAGESRQQRRRSRRAAKKVSQGARLGAAKRD